MSHMVIYRGADGKPGYHQTDDIHDAVMYVESLRNDKDVDHARIFRLEEVTFEYKPYYRVEINTGGSAAVAAPAVSAVADTNGHDDVVETTEASDDDDVADEIEDAVDEVEDVADDVADAADDASDADADADDSAEDEAPTSGARRGLFGR